MSRIALALHLIVAVLLAGQGAIPARGSDEQPAEKGAAPKADTHPWNEKSVLETAGSLPVSVVYSSDGKMMVVGGTDGKVIALDPATGNPIWKAEVGGTFASVAFTPDGKSIVATFADGVRFLDAATGELGTLLEAKGTHPVRVSVFPDQEIVAQDQKYIHRKIIFGTARGSTVKSWIAPGAAGTIELSTIAKGKSPTDPTAVPLAVDPAGRSVIVTGPIDGRTGKNVLWAWVAGNYETGSPGNRLLEGHEAPVVSAAWSTDGKTAQTGDSAGRVILWDAKTMKEAHHLELGGRVAALALSSRGESGAVVVVGNRADLITWQTAQPKLLGKPIPVETADFSGPIHACLAFSPDGRQLAGSAINLAWLARSGRLVGKLHVWQSEMPNPE